MINSRAQAKYVIQLKSDGTIWAMGLFVGLRYLYALGIENGRFRIPKREVLYVVRKGSTR